MVSIDCGCIAALVASAVPHRNPPFIGTTLLLVAVGISAMKTWQDVFKQIERETTAINRLLLGHAIRQSRCVRLELIARRINTLEGCFFHAPNSFSGIVPSIGMHLPRQSE